MLSRILRGAGGPAVTRFTWSATAGHESAGPGGNAGTHTDESARRKAETEEHAATRVREARQAGYAEGQAAGRTQAAAELQPVLEKLGRGIQEIAGLRPHLMREAQGQMAELSLRIARRILHRELSVDPGALDGLVGAALAKLAGQEICRIRIHPEMEPGVRQALSREARGGLVVIADGTLERGALLIETARGKLDASLETQLAEIGRGLADRVSGR